MKKNFFISAAILTFFLCGCQSDKNTETYDYGDDISKAQEITVVSADTSEVIDTITSKEDIEAFVTALDMDKWKLKALSEEATEIGSFGFSQEETVKLGQTDTDGTLYDIAAITLYNDSCIGFEIGGLDMTFEVGNDTADYLNGYFE